MAAMTRKEHRRRIRRHARKVTWAGAPLVLAAIVLWLFVRAGCWGEATGEIENAACQSAFSVPVMALALILFFIGLCVWAFADYGAALRGEPKPKRRFGVAALGYHARNIHAGYSFRVRDREEEHKHRMVVNHAIEMFLWAIVTLVTITVFYFYYYSISYAYRGVPLTLLVAAALARVAYVLLRRFIAWIRNTGDGGTSGGRRPKPHGVRA